MSEIVVSVYCLAYNHEKYIRSALEGFVNQKTNFKYEVWVHDDASLDGTADIIREYAQKYPDIIKPIFQEENQYSKGKDIFLSFILPNMTGKYIAPCERDDFWTDERKLQRQVDFLEQHNDYVACVHNSTLLNLWTNKSERMYARDRDEDLRFFEVIQRGAACYHTSSLLYRSVYAYDRPYFFQLSKHVGDYPLSIYLCLSGKVRFLNYNMSTYRFGSENSWTANQAMDLKKQVFAYKNTIAMLKAANEYSNFKYDAEIKEVISQHEYWVEECSGNYSALRKEPYARIYKLKPLDYKIKTYIMQFFRKPYHLYRKLKYKR